MVHYSKRNHLADFFVERKEQGELDRSVIRTLAYLRMAMTEPAIPLRTRFMVPVPERCTVEESLWSPWRFLSA